MASEDKHVGFRLPEAPSQSGEEPSSNTNAPNLLTKVDLHLAYASEKLLNLEILLMEVARRSNDIEFPQSENNDMSIESIREAFEFNILAHILESEVMVLDDSISSLHTNIVNVEKSISSDESSVLLGEKFQNSKNALKQLQDLISNIMKESHNFRQATDFIDDRHWTGDNLSGRGQISLSGTKLQTQDQQRQVLKMLEKSLAAELELDAKLSEALSTQQELKMKLLSAEEEVCELEEYAEAVSKRAFHAEHTAEVFFGISKELTNKISMAQIVDHETSILQATIASLEEELKVSRLQLQKANAAVDMHIEKEGLLNSELRGLGDVLEELRQNISTAETRASDAEEKCGGLIEANAKLSDELCVLQNRGFDRANFLERKLKETEEQLEEAKASVDATVEQQNMLKLSTSDMEVTINDLKAKVLKAENRAENAESTCHLITETNSELNEEIGALRNRIEVLENSLQKSKEEKVSGAQEIVITTKLITDLVEKLAIERERLQLQISALHKKNKILAERCKRISSEKDDSYHKSTHDIAETEHAAEAVAENSSTCSQAKSVPAERVSQGEEETAVSSESAADSNIVDKVRTIDANQLNWKFISAAILVVLISVLFYWASPEDDQCDAPNY